jgi:fibronectin-binding autotransporter adhesin
VLAGATLSVNTDAELGATGLDIGRIALRGGELLTTTDGFNTARTVDVGEGENANILAATAGTTATYTGVLSDVGRLTVGDRTNTGTVVLTGNNTYSGGTTVVGGVLSVADDSNLGAPNGGLTLTGGELKTTVNFTTARMVRLNTTEGFSDRLFADSGTTATYQGVISGPGALTVAGPGTVVLTAADTYTGGTTINAGTLQLGDGVTTGSIIGNVTDNGTLAFDPAASVSFAGAISGTGNLVKLSSGTVILIGTNTYSGGTTINAGTLQLGDGVTDGSVTGDITNNGTLEFDTIASVSNGGAISGTGNLVKLGGGLVALAGNNTYSGVTTISNGTIQAGSATAFSPNSAFTVNAVLDLNGHSNAVGSLAGNGTVTNGGGTPATLTAGGNNANTSFGGILIDGPGGLGLSKTGVGTLILTGTNTYTGGTTINGGTLQIGTGGDTGSILGDVVDNAALVVNRSGTLVLAGAISGTGSLSQIGSGTLNLTGTSTYSGATAVSAGTLQVDGVLGNTAVTVQNGATLAGQGTIGGSVTILNGGHLAQSSVAQTLSVGSLLLNPASILDYRLSTPGAVGSGVNTLVNVAGNLTLDGLLNVTNGGSFGSGSYRLFNYGGALTNLTLDLGTLPEGFTAANTTVTTAVAGQVNLVVNAAGAPVQFWDGSNTVNDGTVHGGNGTWINFVTNNFTNAKGTVNEAWQNGFAIFTAAPGTVTLGGDILYQGMEFSSDGYTIVGADAFALHPTGTAMIITDTDVTTTIAAPIAGPGGLNKAGPGLLILTGENTYLAGTTISGGALRVASDTNLGDAGGGLTLDTGELETSADFTTARTISLVANEKIANILAAAANTTATYAGVISGAGGLSVGDGTNTGTVVFTGANTYAGGTNILPGTLVAAGNDALGTGPVQLFNGTLTILAGVTLPNEVTFVEGGVLNNAGTLNNNVLDAPDKMVTVINSGIINGNVTIGGSTDIVQLFTGSKITGNLSLGGTTNSTLILDGTGQQSLSAAVVGTVTNNGTLVKQGSGTWTIDRALDAPLGTDILAGTLVVDAVLTTAQVNITPGGVLQLNSGGSVGNLVDNGSFIFAGSGTVTFDAVISGTGNVIQNGPGTTILSGKNTYSGGTIIDLGTLLVNNPQALGTGNVTVNGGVLGADPQPINVLGNYTQNAGGTLQLNIAGRSAGQFDVLNVGGNASLNGTLRLLNLGYQPQNGDKLQLVNTGGVVSGRFAKFQNPFALTAGFNTIDLVYARQSVTLEFLEVNGPPAVVTTTNFGSFAFTPNERAAASLLDAVQLDPRAANLISFLNKEPFANLPGDFNKISPADLSAFYEISFSNANIQRLNLESRMDDLHNGSNGFSSNMKVNGATVNLEDRVDADGKSSKAVVEPILQPGPGNRWGVWMTGFGDFVSVDGDANANGYNFTTGGVSLGIDYRLTDELVVGVMAEYSHTWTSLKPSGSNDVNSGRGGVYATWSHHGFYLNGAIYGGYNSYNSSRSALQGLTSGNTEGAELSTFISGGYDFHFGLLTVGPVAALQYTYANINGFSENGSLAPMQIQSNSANSLRSDVGFRLFYQWQVGKVIIEPSLKAAWEHEYLYSALPITAGFANIPGPTATFTGPAEGHDSAIVSAGVSVLWTPTLTTYLNYDGQLGRGNYDSNAVTGGVRISF